MGNQEDEEEPTPEGPPPREPVGYQTYGAAAAQPSRAPISPPTSPRYTHSAVNYASNVPSRSASTYGASTLPYAQGYQTGLQGVSYSTSLVRQPSHDQQVSQEQRRPEDIVSSMSTLEIGPPPDDEDEVESQLQTPGKKGNKRRQSGSQTGVSQLVRPQYLVAPTNDKETDLDPRKSLNKTSESTAD